MGTTTVWAQGFGPDPFRPYNSQYEPYVRAIGPASPAAGQSGLMNAIREPQRQPVPELPE